ncbi:hypothetical protein DTO280E4_389 [Paecilomyces variotii]|nr:hypothetical protein DTO280E4_389 [Paecilomyces variotii]
MGLRLYLAVLHDRQPSHYYSTVTSPITSQNCHHALSLITTITNPLRDSDIAAPFGATIIIKIVFLISTVPLIQTPLLITIVLLISTALVNTVNAGDVASLFNVSVNDVQELREYIGIFIDGSELCRTHLSRRDGVRLEHFIEEKLAENTTLPDAFRIKRDHQNFPRLVALVKQKITEKCRQRAKRNSRAHSDTCISALATIGLRFSDDKQSKDYGLCAFRDLMKDDITPTGDTIRVEDFDYQKFLQRVNSTAVATRTGDGESKIVYKDRNGSAAIIDEISWAAAIMQLLQDATSAKHRFVFHLERKVQDISAAPQPDGADRRNTRRLSSASIKSEPDTASPQKRRRLDSD